MTSGKFAQSRSTP